MVFNHQNLRSTMFSSNVFLHLLSETMMQIQPTSPVEQRRNCFVSTESDPWSSSRARAQNTMFFKTVVFAGLLYISCAKTRAFGCFCACPKLEKAQPARAQKTAKKGKHSNPELQTLHVSMCATPSSREAGKKKHYETNNKMPARNAEKKQKHVFPQTPCYSPFALSRMPFTITIRLIEIFQIEVPPLRANGLLLDM